jgi:hypothetical protein
MLKWLIVELLQAQGKIQTRLGKLDIRYQINPDPTTYMITLTLLFTHNCKSKELVNPLKKRIVRTATM